MIEEVINSLLKENNMTIEQLEEKAEIKLGSIKNWNKSFPSVDKVQKVAKILNTTPYYLITGEELSKDKIIAMTEADREVIKEIFNNSLKNNKKEK